METRRTIGKGGVANEGGLKMIFGASQSLYCYGTYQFEDYGKMVSQRIDVAAKERRGIFPRDCEIAFIAPDMDLVDGGPVHVHVNVHVNVNEKSQMCRHSGNTTSMPPRWPINISCIERSDGR